MNLLEALLRNESGGRNIPNVHQGTSSGQAQGYFQITTGTWDEFGGREFAARPLDASYAQQAEIASRIPLRRWDESTVRLMRGTGKPIDPNRTLGENLRMNGENFGSGVVGSGSKPYSTRFVGGTGSGQGSFASTSPGYSTRHVGGAGSEPNYFAPAGGTTPPQTSADVTAGELAKLAEPNATATGLAQALASAVGKSKAGGVEQSDITLPKPPPLQYQPLETAINAPPMEAPAPDLASLFKVGDIGQPQGINPFTGLPLNRRQYG